MKPKIGVLVVNLGTADGYDFFSIRRYLAEFLSDHRIIELNKCLWYPLLYGVILNKRPQKTGKLYKKIWNIAGPNTGSPLRYYTEQQVEKLEKLLKEKYKQNLTISVQMAMRYGKPNIKHAIKKFAEQNYDKLIILPLFPQYSATTTGSIFDACFQQFMAMRNIPSITTIKSFATHPLYIEALAQLIKNHLNSLDFTPQKILMSFHGIPKSYCDQGDPYYEECYKSVLALKNYMKEDRLLLCFQSRFGKAEWTGPYSSAIVKQLAKENIKDIAIINPGFISDCLETIDEIGRELREEYLAHGGKNFSRIPCLNDSEEAINLLANLCEHNLNNF